MRPAYPKLRRRKTSPVICLPAFCGAKEKAAGWLLFAIWRDSPTQICLR